MIEFETLGDDYNGIKEQVNKIWSNLSRQIFAEIKVKGIGINVHVSLTKPWTIDGVCIIS